MWPLGFYDFPYSGNNHRNWFSYFFRGAEKRYLLLNIQKRTQRSTMLLMGRSTISTGPCYQCRKLFVDQRVIWANWTRISLDYFLDCWHTTAIRMQVATIQEIPSTQSNRHVFISRGSVAANQTLAVFAKLVQWWERNQKLWNWICIDT